MKKLMGLNTEFIAKYPSRREESIFLTKKICSTAVLSWLTSKKKLDFTKVTV
jgi:hypothetical protein